jgi:CheY-like chemotaxis protein
MIASGMLRGLVVADRLVWRLGAEPCPAPGPAPAQLQNAVRGDDGKVYWVADPGVLLAPLTPPTIHIDVMMPPEEPVPAESPRVETAKPFATDLRDEKAPAAPQTPAATDRRDEPAPSAPPTPAATDRRDEPAPSAPPTPAANPSQPDAVLEIDDVAPLPLAQGTSATEPATAPTAPAEAAATAPSRRALVVEDSITARIFLSRMLEARGFSVVAVASGADALREALRGPWWLVCADVELGDVRGAGWLRMLRERVGATSPLAALVRDREDREVALAAGVSRVLRKPFDEAELSELIQRVADTRESS